MRATNATRILLGSTLCAAFGACTARPPESSTASPITGCLVRQHDHGSSASASALDAPFAGSVVAGDLLVVAVSAWAGNKLQPPTDAQGNAWTLAVTASQPGNSVAAIYYAFAKSTAQDTITCHTQLADNIHCHVYDVAGISNSAPVVLSSGSNTQSGTKALTVATAGSVQANDYVLSFFADNNANVLTAGSGFGDVDVSSTGGDVSLSEDQIASATGVQIATASASNADAFTNLTVAFHVAASTDPPPDPPPPDAGSLPPHVIQHAQSASESAAALGVVLPKNVTAGDLLIAAESTWTGNTLNAPTDAQGNAWTLAVSAAETGQARSAIYYTFAKSTSADTVTCHASGADNLHCHVYEVSGTSGLGATGSNVQASTNAPTVSTSTSVQAGDYVFAYFADDDNDTLTAGTGYTDTGFSNPGADAALSEDRLAAITGTQTATASATTSHHVTSLIAAFHAAGGTSSTHPPPADAGTPSGGSAIKKIFYLMEENRDSRDVYGAADAPYFNDVLMATYAWASNYGDVIHPSEPNYVWLEAGDNLGITTDDDPGPSNSVNTTDHIVNYLGRVGKTWRSYQEDLPGSCGIFSSGQYAAKHNPFVFFQDVVGSYSNVSTFCTSHVVDLGRLATDITNDDVADYVEISPNLCNDGHDCGNGTVEAFLQSATIQKVFAYVLNPANHAILIIDWDEGETQNTHPMMLVAPPATLSGTHQITTALNHDSFVRSVQRIFGIDPSHVDPTTGKPFAWLRGAGKTGVTDFSSFFAAGQFP